MNQLNMNRWAFMDNFVKHIFSTNQINVAPKNIVMKQLKVFKEVKFNGAGYDPAVDYVRLKSQLETIYELMVDGKWRTLNEIELITQFPAASISAQLRNLRKKSFGSNIVNRRARGDRKTGLFEYQLIKTNN
jgi:hypothetical protein